jgi:hypothetical protein
MSFFIVLAKAESLNEIIGFKLAAGFFSAIFFSLFYHLNCSR